MVFNANGIIYTKDRSEWGKEVVDLHSVEDIRNQFGEAGNSLSQSHVSKYMKVYYVLEDLSNGSYAKIKQSFDILPKKFMVVFCNDTQPVKIPEDYCDKVRDCIDFY